MRRTFCWRKDRRERLPALCSQVIVTAHRTVYSSLILILDGLNDFPGRIVDDQSFRAFRVREHGYKAPFGVDGGEMPVPRRAPRRDRRRPDIDGVEPSKSPVCFGVAGEEAPRRDESEKRP